MFECECTGDGGNDMRENRIKCMDKIERQTANLTVCS